MSEKPMMECGHVANAIDARTGEPCCVICNEFRTKIVSNNFSERKAICMGCKHGKANTVESSMDLPFFQHRPDEEYDSYYCGCWGWD